MNFHRVAKPLSLLETVGMAETERFVLKKGQVVTARGYVGTFKILDVSADGDTADIRAFSLSKQMLLGAVMKGIPCSILVHFKEDASQAAARIVKEATDQK